MAGAHHHHPLSFILKPTGASRDFPSCAPAGGYFCSLIKKIRDDHRGSPGELVFTSLMTSRDFRGWQMTDSTSSIRRVLPPHVRLETAVSATIVCERVLNHNRLQREVDQKAVT